MKKTSIIAIIVSGLLLAGIIVAGCTQPSTDSSAAPVSGDQSGGGNAPPADNSVVQGNGNSNTNPGAPGGNPNGNGYAGYGAGGNHTFHGGFLTNTTLLTAAAAQLGVSETDLQSALSGSVSSNGRPNLTAAAQTLGVTPQQLMSALGFPSGGFRGRNMTNTMTSPAETQSP